jgi:HTH-type transcriptional regulator / antitoxin HipB
MLFLSFVNHRLLLVANNLQKTAISRIENHAEDIKLSTLEKFANALGKNLKLEIA